MNKLLTIIIIFFCLSSYGQYDYPKNVGLINIQFVDSIKEYQNFDSIFGSNFNRVITKYLSSHVCYPKTSRENCEEDNVLLEFKLIDKKDFFIIDTTSINIVSGIYQDLISEAKRQLKEFPSGRVPCYAETINYNQNLKFAISFDFKVINCDDPIWRNDSFPENGYYVGFYKYENRKRVEGYFKKGKPDSLWIFYDISGTEIAVGYCNYNLKPNIYSGNYHGFIGEKIGSWEYNYYDRYFEEKYTRKKKTILELWMYDFNDTLLLYRKGIDGKIIKEEKYKSN